MNPNNEKGMMSPDMPASRLSTACLRDIGSKLSIPVGKNYEDLAAAFGFTHEEVEQFSLQDHSNPGLSMLRTWCQRENATVKVLQEYLKWIGRQDVLKVIEEELQDRVLLVFDIKSNGEIICSGTIETFGYCSIRSVLEGKSHTKRLISKLPKDILDKKVSEYKGRHLQINVDDKTFTGQPKADFKDAIQEEHISPDSKKSLSFSSSDQTCMSPTDQLNLAGNNSQRTRAIQETESEQDSTRSFSFRSTDQMSSGDTLSESLRSSLDLWSTDEVLGFHSEATSQEKIEQIMGPHMREEGAYILRASRNDPNDMRISVIENGSIEHYKIYVTRDRCRYYIYDNDHFDSIRELLMEYSKPSSSPVTDRLKLSRPIP